MIQAKQRFSKSIHLDETEIHEFALAAGDSNPLHHDGDWARARGHRGPVASGPQSSALLMGMVADHFSRLGPMVGLEFNFRFKAAVPAREALDLEWMIIRVTPKPRLGGLVVELRGRLRTASGETAVGAKGTVLVYGDFAA